MKKDGIMELKLQSIDDLIEKVRSLPQERFYFEGIKENSLNLLIAPPKVGKTTFAENLAFTIAAGHNSYLGKAVWCGENKKVSILSLEEYFRGRTERNRLQLEYMDEVVGNRDWHQNINVMPEHGPRYIESKEDWKFLINYIDKAKPAFTVIDSLSRMHGSEAIEDSSTCILLMKNLRHIVESTGTTLLVIHHTSKIRHEPLTLSNMAGSRILSQEGDAIIALNKTPSGKRYIKPLAYRYADDSSDNVQLFTRNEHQFLESAGDEKEYKILREFDNRQDDTNTRRVINYISDYTSGDNSVIIETKKLIENLVTTGQMSKPTMHKALHELEENQTIIRQGKGIYTLPQK